MTNGEKIIEIFPSIEVVAIVPHEVVVTKKLDGDGEYTRNSFRYEWWNAEYQEPTTKDNITQERYQDLIEYFGDEKVAKTILEDRKEFKAWLERLRWNVKRADELARELERIKGTTKNDLPHCQYSDEEIAKSFIEDVEAVKDQLPCGEQMDFPSTFDEFAKDYGFKDKDEVYTNGSELIPVFRVKQWLEHISTTKNDLGVDCIDRVELLKAMDTWDKFGNDPDVGLIPLRTPALQDRYVPYVHYYDMVNCVKGMPSVTPQLSSGLEKNSKKLEKDFGESDCISRTSALDSINWAYNLSDAYQKINDLPSITSQEPKIVTIAEIKYDEDKLKELVNKAVLTVAPQQPTIENDLGVDCIDRQATLDAIIKRLGIKNES